MMNLRLVSLSAVRVLMFAVAGAVCMALVGGLAGSATGALYQYLDEITFGYKDNSQALEVCKSGATNGSIVAAVIGAITGAVAFGVAGILSCLSAASWLVLKAACKFAARSSLCATLVFLSLSIFYFYSWMRWKGETLYFPRTSYLLVVIISFGCGTFYGAIVGAKREIARQKQEKR